MCVCMHFWGERTNEKLRNMRWGRRTAMMAFHRKPFSDQFCERRYMEGEGLESDFLKTILGAVYLGNCCVPSRVLVFFCLFVCFVLFFCLWGRIAGVELQIRMSVEPQVQQGRWLN